MTYGEVDRYIEHMNNEGLVALCNNVYDWHYIDGILKPGCTLLQLSENLEFTDTRYIANKVIEVATERLGKLVLLLFQESTHKFLKVQE